jgi:hypothetical protein
MIIHSIVPLDVIFSSDTQEDHNEVIDYGQIKLEVRKIENKDYEVVRIISTNPEDYLKADLQPGSILKARYQPGEK